MRLSWKMWAPGRCSRRARFGPRESDDVVVATARADHDKRGSGANERPVTPSRRARGHGSRRSRPRLVDVVTGVRVEVAGFALPEATCGGVAGRVRLPVDAAGREVGSPHLGVVAVSELVAVPCGLHGMPSFY